MQLIYKVSTIKKVNKTQASKSRNSGPEESSEVVNINISLKNEFDP
jgi:hypothetical protein